jgi:hypothetical protein
LVFKLFVEGLTFGDVVEKLFGGLIVVFEGTGDTVLEKLGSDAGMFAGCL